MKKSPLMKKNKSKLVKLLSLFVALILVNVIGGQYYKRFDLTQDHRYTLSNAALHTLDSIDSPLIIDVFSMFDPFIIFSMRSLT